MISIKHRFTNTVLCEFDVPTIKEAVVCAVKGGADLRGADLRDANLRYANLRYANLCGANLRDANLRYANLCGANLRDANLRYANLCGANLRYANLYGADLRYANLYGADLGDEAGKLKADGFFSVGPLGSRKDTMFAFHTGKGVFIRAGCFFGSLALFREKVIATHGENSKHGKLYLGMANVIEFKFSEVE